MNKFSLVSKLFFALILFVCVSKNTDAQNYKDMSSLFGKDEITIVITDSGLGGLSVMEDIGQKMKKSGYFKSVHLLFVNALFDVSTGYNTLQNRDEKIKMFNSVLNGINNRYHPDAIIIACNTLSVISPETEFVKSSRIPVIGIVESGVQLIIDNLNNDKNSRALILGTETTIEEDSHRKLVLESGITSDRIITKACPQLQSYIEQSPEGEETGMLISLYLNEALEDFPKDCPLLISLNCSHFGYSSNSWNKAMDELGFTRFQILNPNSKMGEVLMPEKYKNRFANSSVSFQVVSKVELLNVKSMLLVFQKSSPELAKAIENYILLPSLFNNN